MNELLKFSKGNAKLDKQIFNISLPSGFSCPGALDCLSKADPITGKITDGKDTKFRCFSASSEAVYTAVRDQRWHNFKLLAGKTMDQMKELIVTSLPSNANIIRVHVGGDFFNEDYFKAWLNTAKQFPSLIFYAYTKSLNFWVNNLKDIPGNFKLNASFGGRHDAMITQHALKYAKVVYTVDEADKLGLEIDHDDTHAFIGDNSFALLLHGTQPKGTVAAKSLSALRKLGIGGYGRDKAKRAEITLTPTV
jgi:hypothetical protein